MTTKISFCLARTSTKLDRIFGRVWGEEWGRGAVGGGLNLCYRCYVFTLYLNPEKSDLQYVRLKYVMRNMSLIWMHSFFATGLCCSQLAFYVNLHRAVIGPSATLTGRWRPDIDFRRMLTWFRRGLPANALFFTAESAGDEPACSDCAAFDRLAD